MELLGFWSYVHADDDMSMGRATALAHDIVSNYESIQAESIQLFLEREGGLRWGDQWREIVDESLSNVAFFIPVVSPRYLVSSECRREFQYFEEKAKALGIRELIMPILWIETPELREDVPADPIARILKEIQWEDWTEKRFLDRDTGAYQRAVFELASELVRRAGVIERADIPAALEVATSTPEADDGDESPGRLDRFAALEEALPRWGETAEALTQEVRRIGAMMDEGTVAMEAADVRGGNIFAARLTLARLLAERLMEPVERIEALGLDFANDLAAIDSGVRALIELASESSEEERVEAEDQFTSIRAMALVTYGTREGMSSMLASMEPLVRMSKDMRKPIRPLRKSISAMGEAVQIAAEWTALMDAAGLGDPLKAAANAEAASLETEDEEPTA